MDEGYTYGIPGTDERMSIYLPAEYEAPLSLELDGAHWVRISDRVLTCEPALWQNTKKGAKQGDLVMTKCGGGFECHRTVLGQCMCGLHDKVVLEPAT